MKKEAASEPKPQERLLQQIVGHYLGSGDFNGLYFEAEDPRLLEAAIDLVRDGLVQVMSEEDYLNIHIRPWPSRRTTDQQIESLRQLKDAEYGVCLYPNPPALKGVRAAQRFPGQPYRQAMAKGRGTLELAYFRFDVLEQYKNDPRFSFSFGDFGATAWLGDDAYLDDTESEEDKTGISHIGFAYDLSGYSKSDPDSPIVRRVAAFYVDLMKLSATHQQRWKTYEVDGADLHPHPSWWASQMGHWPEGLGPFERLFLELEYWSELHERIYGVPLLHVTERPGDFGWILRPSQHEWDSFVLQLDKVLSENIRHEALDAVGHVPKTDDQGRQIGTLNRLRALLEWAKVDEELITEGLRPLREIRAARQKPAHALRANVSDKTFVHKQVELMERVNASVNALRHFWQTHPRNRDWVPHFDEEGKDFRM